MLVPGKNACTEVGDMQSSGGGIMVEPVFT